MGRPQKPLHEVQGHRTRKELDSRRAEEAERLAEQAEDALIDSLPDRFPPSAPGIPVRREFLDDANITPYFTIRKKLIAMGKAQVNDTPLLVLYVEAHRAGQLRLAYAIELLIYSREQHTMPPLPPRDPQRILDFMDDPQKYIAEMKKG